MELTNWEARRAGGRITAEGTGQDGTPAKIVGIDKITPIGGRCIAIDREGVQHTLHMR